VNEGEAKALLGVDEETVVDAENLAARVGRLARSAVVTLGPAGAVLAQQGAIKHVPAEQVPVVDTTGAGDAFTGALAATLCQDADLLAAVRRGVAAGGFAVSRAGARAGYPTTADLPAP
jgi:ribokinase